MSEENVGDTYRSPAPTPRYTMELPYGLGGYVAFERTMHPSGNKNDDLVEVVKLCDLMGMSWIAPRAGAGGNSDAAFDEVSAGYYIGKGKKVYPWVFPYKGTEKAVVALFKRHFLGGAQGCIINAEFEYQSATYSEAKFLVKLIHEGWAEAQGEFVRTGRSVVADLPFIGHAPPDYLGAGVGHALSDELVALDEVCDAIMPQVYAFEHNDMGHKFHLERVAEGYRKRGFEISGPESKLWWIGCTYRPKTRGGKPTPLMVNEAEIVAKDVIAFLDHELVRGCRAPSLYSLDATKWINGKDDRVVSAVAEWHRQIVTVEQVPSPRTIPIYERREGEKEYKP